ncbi:uncharacterized protein LOC123530295 isoform X2 [Mercenaria mercenaria]|uniref:uncharacterized protein LOC123530295 isoform X2 n=1 Tax=Mercenaria mercenaria TaxID=6596 RepID=UPI00234F5BCD|nr:uncharacterized protein LOC123530295 isoform X2 [Mercenaria mercenaria]
MSCFGGRMQEYDRVSLDRFDGKNLQSTVYFLSHLHEDHTAGLGEKIFLKRLKSNKDIFLYCSEVTQVLLVASKKYHHLEPYIRGLSINTPTTVDIPDPLYEEKEKITVTLLPAFHCPGSVMFLIEGKEGTVLYTGDFRWEHFNIEQMHHLRSGESVKKIKSLYIDTTFCTPESLHIPSRQQCIEAVCQLVHEWTSISPKHVVNIYLRAQYGHEPLLNAVASKLNKKVHVNEHKVSVYNRIQEFHGKFTTEGINTQLHACNKDCMIDVDGESILCREAHDADKVLAILPTTMYFTQFQHLTLDKIVKKINSNFFRACYSFHSSYTEVKDLLSYLKPERVYPNVKPPTDTSLAVTQHRLNTMLKECLEKGAGEVVQSEEVKELGTLKTRSGRQVRKRKGTDSTSDADSLDFGTPVKSARYSLSCSMEADEPAITESSSTGKRKGRGRGRGKGKAETASQPAVGTRRSTRRSAATPTHEETTPKKSKKSERSPTPDLFLTPASDTSDQHSSFYGSERSDSELSLFSSQKSLDLAASGEAANSWTAGSFLAAVSSSCEDDAAAGRFCLSDDEEQTDEQFEDLSQFTDTEEEEEGLNLEQLGSVVPPDNVGVDDNTALTTETAKSKGITKSPVKRGKGGKKGTKKSTHGQADAACTESSVEQNIDDHKELDSDANTDSKIVVESDSDTVLRGTDKNPSLLDEVVTKDGEKAVLETINVVKGIDTDTKVALVGSIVESTAAQREGSPETDAEIDSCSANASDEQLKDDNVITYLGTPVKHSEESTSGSLETTAEKDVQAEKITTDVSGKGKIDNVTESSEDLHLHLSETTHDSEEDSNESNICSKDNKDNEVIIIDSDSLDEVDSGKQDTSIDATTKVSENDRNFGSVEIVSHINEGIPADAVMIVDSDSNEVANCDFNNVSNDKDDSNNISPEIEKKQDNTESETKMDVQVSKNPEQEKKVHSIEKSAEKIADIDPQTPEEYKTPSLVGVEQDISKSESRKSVPKSGTSQCIGEGEHIDREDGNQDTGCIKVIEENINEKDAAEGTVQTFSVESTNSIISSKEVLGKNDGITKPEDDLNESMLMKDDMDDDVIEIVDLTGDDMTGQKENQETMKPGKKTIKISLLTKTEPIRKVKKTVEENNFEKEEKEDTENNSESDIDDINEISSSPEWLSVRKVSEQKSRYSDKKTKMSKRDKSVKRDDPIGVLEDTLKESGSDENSSVKLSKKELDERAEVRRQALGFMCETDSESDTDESSDPGSPEAAMLYDDYVELSSDSDNEDGIGGKGKGGKAFGRKPKSSRRKGDFRNGSLNGNSGSTTQGWLNSRKHSDVTGPTDHDTVLDKISNIETSEDIHMAEVTDAEIQQGPQVNKVDETRMNLEQIDQSVVSDVTVLDQESPAQTVEGNDLMKENIEKKIDQAEHHTVQVQIVANEDTHGRLTEKTGIEVPPEPPFTCLDNIDLNTSQNTDNATSNQDSALQTVESSKLVETSNMKNGASGSVLDRTSSGAAKTADLSTSDSLDKEIPLHTEKENDLTEKNTVKDMEEVNQDNSSTHSVFESQEETKENTVQDTFMMETEEQLKTSNSTDQSEEVLSKDGASEKVTSVGPAEESEVDRTNVENEQEPTVLAEDKTTLEMEKNSDKREKSESNVFTSNKDSLQAGEKNDVTEKADTVTELPQLDQAENSKKNIQDSCTISSDVPVPDFASSQSKNGQEEEKILQSGIEEKTGTKKVTTEESSDKTDSKSNMEKSGQMEPSREMNKQLISNKKVTESTSDSATLESDKTKDGSKKSAKSKKVIDWRKLPPSNVSKVSNIINYTDEPAPPGTEDPPTLKQETNKISSVVSKSRPIKTFLHKVNVPATPPPSTPVQRPLYNLLVAGGTPTHIPPPGVGPPYNYQYSRSAPPPQIPNYPPPRWIQYPYGPPPSVPFPPPTAFTQPPPGLPFSPVIPPPVVSPPVTVVATAKSPMNPLMPPPVTVAPVSTIAKLPTSSWMPPFTTMAPIVQRANTTVYKTQGPVAAVTQSTKRTLSVTPTTDTSTTDSTRTVTINAPKSKKLASWQQKKADIFERGPSCIAKKDVKPKININIGKTPSQQRKHDALTLTPPISEGQSQNQEDYVDNLSRLSQQGFKQRQESTDLATIKANIAALTGLHVADTAKTAPDVPPNFDENQSKGEDLPALVEQLKRLEEVQALLEAANTKQSSYGNNRKETIDVPKETFRYDHPQHADYSDREDYYDRRGARRDRLSRDDEFESEHRRRSYEYEGRERDNSGRYRSRDYADYEGRERSYVDYDRRDREYVDYEKRERMRDYERLDRDYLEYRERRDVTYERRNTDYVDYERGDRNYLEYERREREFERRYREEEDYKHWLEERRRKESYRDERRLSPSRYPGYDDRSYEDPYYDRMPPPRPRDPEYEKWLERGRQTENYSMNRRDSYERYDHPTPGPWSHPAYEDRQPRFPVEQPKPSVDWNRYDSNDIERQEYGTDMTTPQEVLPETRTVQRPTYTESVRNTNLDPFKKKPIMARVLSRSGQLLSVQSEWKTSQQPQTVTTPDVQEQNTDLPVFLTGMKYYGSPTDT